MDIYTLLCALTKTAGQENNSSVPLPTATCSTHAVSEPLLVYCYTPFKENR